VFTHLHVHSHYSLLDGLPKIADLVLDAKHKGFTALALTDHGAMYGAIEFYKKCKSEGIKPIIGMEAYITAGSMKSKVDRQADKPYHLTILAKNFEGYKNLMKLTTLAHIEGFYYRPRIDFETLVKHKDGLIILSGCQGSELSQAIIGGNLEKAEKIAQNFATNFGPENYYLEIQRQPITGDDEFARVRKSLNQNLATLSRKLSLALTATGDSHYLEPDDATAQDTLVCIGTGKIVTDSNRLDMKSANLSLMTESQMRELFSDIPEALVSTQKIADMVDIKIPLEKFQFPYFETPDDLTQEDYLKKLAYEGVSRIYNLSEVELKKDRPEILNRVDYELDIIKTKKYPSYFLIFADFANWSKANGIFYTTRGSAAGSLVAYALGITTINPLVYNLPFERFLNPERPSAPDIDMDFADNRRDEVIDYVTKKYGKDKVAQIVTFGTMMARAAVRDVGRALGVAYSKCDKIAKLIPFGKQGFQMTIDRAIKISPELKLAYEQDAETKQIIDLSKKLEGVARHPSVHAAGVVISPTPLTDFTPLRKDTDSETITTQYDMHACESAGLVKMDFLGIRNLSILGTAVDLVKKTKNITIDLHSLPLDDKITYDLLAAGNTVGLFQLGGSGMTKYLKDLKPTKVEDIMAMVALYRPGPMESIPEFIARKHDPKLVTYLDPSLKEILESSYGVLTYQDDVLLISIKIAGYSWLEADKLRKAMGKKIPREMAEQKEKFIDGCMKNGWTSAKTLKLWSLIEPFAAYGFGKAHAASYGMVAYQTAYMKANYPVEFMAAVLSAESGKLETVAEAVSECVHMGIKVLPPDINESFRNFTVVDEQNIRFGLEAIKNLGSDVVDKIIAERKANGKFLDLSSFVSRTFVKNFNKKSWEALVKSGALDSFGERNSLLATTEKILELARSFFREKDSAQNSLFGSNSHAELKITLNVAVPATEKEKLSWEKELLGLYVTSHPLHAYKKVLENLGTSVTQIVREAKKKRVTFAGIVTKVKTILTKKGDQMAFAEVEDLGGSIELVVFPNAFNESRNLLLTDKLVKVSGKFESKDGEPKILVDKIEELDNGSSTLQGSVEEKQTSWPSSPLAEGGGIEDLSNQETSTKRIVLPIPEDADPMIFRKLKTVFEKYPGDVRVALDVPSPHGPKRPVETGFHINPSAEFKTRIKEVLKNS